MSSRTLMTLAVLAVTAGCVSTNVITGTKRAPVPVDQVQVYYESPGPYQEIARLNSSSRYSFTYTDQRKTDAAIARLRQEAAKLGANGVLLTGFEDRPSGSVGFSVGGMSLGRNSSVGVGVGTSTPTTAKAVSALAIYVEAANAPPR